MAIDPKTRLPLTIKARRVLTASPVLRQAINRD
jgi:hypothetical protein